MSNRLISVALIFLLLPWTAWAKTPQEQVLRINQGATVEVRLKTKESVRGKLGPVTAQDLELAQSQNGQIVTKKIAFSDVQSVRQVGGTSKKKIAGFVVLGVVAGAAILAGAAVYSIHHAW